MRTIVECQRRARTWKEEYEYWTRAGEWFWVVMASAAITMLMLAIYEAV